MSTVKIPPVLRAAAGGERTVEASGATVGEVLTATLTGTAADVLLVLWGREALATLDVDGDSEVARSVLAAGITP